MIATLALLLGQVGVPVTPANEIKELTFEVGFLAFDRKMDWKGVPAKKIPLDKTGPNLPQSAMVFNGNLAGLVGAPAELLGEEPKYKLLSRPMIKTLLGQKAMVSTTYAVQLVAKPNAKDPAFFDVEVSYSPEPRKPEDTQPFPFVKTFTITRYQCVGLTMEPDPKKLAESVQLIGFAIAEAK